MDKFWDIDIIFSEETGHPYGYWESRTFRDYNFWLLLEGELEIRCRGGTFRLFPGDLIFFFPGSEYRVVYNRASRIRFNHFLLRRGELSGILGEESRCLLYRRSPHFAALREAGRAWDGGEPWGRLRFTAAVAALFAEAVPRLGELKPFVDDEGYFLATLDQYIFERMQESLTIESVAEAFGRSAHYFSDKVRALCGESLGRRIRRLKMNHARVLLEKSPLKVHEVASAVGFSDGFSFSKAYKRQTGLSPQEFRRRSVRGEASSEEPL